MVLFYFWLFGFSFGSVLVLFWFAQPKLELGDDHGAMHHYQDETHTTSFFATCKHIEMSGESCMKHGAQIV